MLIIFEGIDGGGKSTLAEAIHNKLAVRGETVFRYAHGVPTKPVLLEYTDDLVTYEPLAGEHVICDRLHLGQPVYGPLYRGEAGDSLGRGGRKFIDAFLNERGAIIVNLFADPDVLRQRYAIRGEDYLKDEHIETVLAAYDRVLAESDVPVMRYKSNESFDVDVATDEIIAVARRLELIAAGRFFNEI